MVRHPASPHKAKPEKKRKKQSWPHKTHQRALMQPRTTWLTRVEAKDRRRVASPTYFRRQYLVCFSFCSSSSSSFSFIAVVCCLLSWSRNALQCLLAASFCRQMQTKEKISCRPWTMSPRLLQSQCSRRDWDSDSDSASDSASDSDALMPIPLSILCAWALAQHLSSLAVAFGSPWIEWVNQWLNAFPAPSLSLRLLLRSALPCQLAFSIGLWIMLLMHQAHKDPGFWAPLNCTLTA